MEEIANTYLSVNEYFQLQENSQQKHEYYHGEIFAMAGATKNHNIIVANLLKIFGNHLENKNCTVYPSDMKVCIDEQKHYVYPDVSIVCGDNIFLNEKEDTLLNPTLVVEVLSESTESYDRSKKFSAYRSLPSIKEYVLVSSMEKRIEIFTKSTDGRWYLGETNEVNILFIESLELHLDSFEVYKKLTFIDQN